MREPGDAPARAEADEDDDAATVGDERADGDEAGQFPGGVDGEPVHRTPALERDLLSGGDELAAGVVDEHVDAPEAPERRLDQPLDLVGLADVGRDREALAARGLDLRADRVERLGPAAGHDEPSSVPREHERGRPADPRAASGDDRDARAHGAPDDTKIGR
jgi:hypothetical protein